MTTHPTRPGGHPHARPAVRRLHHDIDERPMIVIWEVTRACQLVCRHCRADSQPVAHPEQLTHEQGKALLDDIAGFGKPLPIVILTGGDAFERPDLEELIRYGAGLGLHMALSPSVTPKLTLESIRTMHAAGVNAMSLSLDGADAATHDGFRGVPGVFDRTLEAAREIRGEGIRLQVNTTVTRDTVEQLPDVFEIMLDVDASLWSLFFLVPTGRGQQLKTLDPPQIEDVLHWMADISDILAVKTTEAPQYRRVLTQRARAKEEGRDPATAGAPRGDLHARLTARTQELLAGRELKRRPPRPPIDINSGRGFAFIDHRGNVYPSGFFPQHCGNVKEIPFPEIYRTDELLRALRRPEGFHGKCGVCEFHEVCGGSRSHAYAVTGDILGSDPTCGYLPQAMNAPHERPGHATHAPH